MVTIGDHYFEFTFEDITINLRQAENGEASVVAYKGELFFDFSMWWFDRPNQFNTVDMSGDDLASFINEVRFAQTNPKARTGTRAVESTTKS